MFLMHRTTGDLIRIDSIDDLSDPLSEDVQGRDQAGQEEQDIRCYAKSELLFPSGEALPQCWTDASYRIQRAQRAK